MTCEKNTFIWRIRSASFCEMYISSFHTSLSIHSGKCSALILRHSPSNTEQNETEKRMIRRDLETETGNHGILLIVSNMIYEPKVQTFEVPKFKFSLQVM